MARKCPKCGLTPLFYTEVWKDFTIQFAALKDGTPEQEGWMEMGEPWKVLARCGCGHVWTLKGIGQITHLRRVKAK